MPIYKLKFHGALHVGVFRGANREGVLEWLPSDSLFAALAAAWQKLNQPVAERANHPDPLRLTSLMPFAGKVRFYPAPAAYPKFARDAGASGKEFKRIRWISRGVLDALRQGQTPLLILRQGGTLWLTADEELELPGLEGDAETLWKTQIVPHVTVDRATSASSLYHTGRVTFAPGCGLWFAAANHADWVREGLSYLQDAGLGGLRSTGHGGFTFCETKESPDQLPAADGWGMCLSRYAPASVEEVRLALKDERAAYRLTNIGGWCQDAAGRAWRRRTVRMVEEGALLPAAAKGALVNVAPLDPQGWAGETHDIWRSGLTYIIPAGKLIEEAQ